MIDTLAREARAFSLFTDAQCLISELIPAMRYAWHIANELHLHALISIIGSSVGITAIWENGLVVGQPLPSPTPTTSITAPSTSSGALVTFEHSSSMFMASLGQGWPWNTALRAWSPVLTGQYSSNGKFFRPMPAPPSTASAHSIILPGTISEHPTTILWDGKVILAISSTSVLRIKTTGKHNRAVAGLQSLPDFICLPRDPSGKPIIPLSRVTALVEAQQAWVHLLGPLDTVSSSIVHGTLVMPKISSPSCSNSQKNHDSLDSDPVAQTALGPVIAKWLAQGILDFVAFNDRQPILLQPCGAVPKGSPPFYRLITDARFANPLYLPWGVSYTSAAQLGTVLQQCDFSWCSDLEDAYHLALWAGCGGGLRRCWRPFIIAPGQIEWREGLINGCDPSTCLGGCDKDLSGIMINGFIFRFAACQFGQSTAGSPLNSLILCISRYFASLPDPVHVSAWVDDLHFSIATPLHPPCLGHKGGCPTCALSYEKAVLAQDHWFALAHALNLPLSKGKGFTVSQSGAFTGFNIDTYLGTITMLTEKFDSVLLAIYSFRILAITTCRLTAEIRGKIMHYGQAVPFLAICAPSLSQLIHAPNPAPPLIDEASLSFDWDAKLQVTSRAALACDLAMASMWIMHKHGCPLWPLVPSSEYGAFLTLRPTSSSKPIIIGSSDASYLGWAFQFQTSSDKLPVLIVGSFRTLSDLLQPLMLLAQLPSEDPEVQVVREALALLFGIQAMARLVPLSQHQILLRNDCKAALAAFRRGSFRSIALQDIAIQYLQLMLEIPAIPALLLFAPGKVLIEEGIDKHSRNTAAELRCSESGPALRALIHQLAINLSWGPLTLDLFATASNSLTPRFYSRFAEPLAEQPDALIQPDWGTSQCPQCGIVNRELIFAFPPESLLPPTLYKAFSDQIRGFIVAPLAITQPFWPRLCAASVLQKAWIELPSSLDFISRPGRSPPPRHALFAVDFSRLHSHSAGSASTPSYDPHCTHASAPRLRLPVESPRDTLDRCNMRKAIISHHLSLPQETSLT